MRESVLSSCFPWYLSPGALYLLSQALFPLQCLLWLVSCLSHIMAGVCFCSAAQKLLEVNVYKQRDARDCGWIRESISRLQWCFILVTGMIWCCFFSALPTVPISFSFMLFQNAQTFPLPFSVLLSHSQQLPKADHPSLGRYAQSTRLMKHFPFLSVPFHSDMINMWAVFSFLHRRSLDAVHEQHFHAKEAQLKSRFR